MSGGGAAAGSVLHLAVPVPLHFLFYEAVQLQVGHQPLPVLRTAAGLTAHRAAPVGAVLPEAREERDWGVQGGLGLAFYSTRSSSIMLD